MDLQAVGTDSKPARVLGPDLARVVMILLMVQGHTLDALWTAAQHQGKLFELWLSVRGLTAPAFLLLSGFSFTLASRRIWEGRSDPTRLQRRINRSLLLVVLGYSMHLPARTFAGLVDADPQGWRTFFQVDVLQCIGVTLLLLQLVQWVTKTPSRFAWTSLAVGTSIVAMTPLLWRLPNSGQLPLVFSSYLNGNGGSQFPLFPWAGYLFMGAALGYLYTQRTSRWLAPKLALSGFVLFAAGTLLSHSPFVVHSIQNFWKTSPTLFITRLGCVVLLVAVSALVAPLLHPQARLIQLIAGESLLIYYIHICILYGSVWNLGLRQYVGATLTISSAATCAGAMIACMVGMALCWNWIKKTWHAQPEWLKVSYWFPS